MSSHWREDALCAQVDPELFVHDAPNKPAALRICRQCPVRDDCLAEAMAAVPQALGIWGGTTEPQRRKMRKQILTRHVTASA